MPDQKSFFSTFETPETITKLILMFTYLKLTWLLEVVYEKEVF